MPGRGAEKATPTVEAEAPPPPGSLSLAECFRMAEDRHPLMRAARERLLAREQAQTAAYGILVPRLAASFDLQEAREPLAGPFSSYFQPDASVATQTLANTLAFRGLLPIGTTYSLSATNTVGWFSSLSAALNPAFTFSLRLELSQPLWRGLGPGPTLMPLDMAEAAVSAEEALLAEEADRLLLEVGRAYLQVVHTAALVELSAESLAKAVRYEELTDKLIKGGMQSALDRAVSLRARAEREVALQQAESSHRDALENFMRALGRKVGEPTVSARNIREEAWALPAEGETDGVTLALAYDPTTVRMRAQLDQARLAEMAAREETRLDIRLTAFGELFGLSGTSTCQGGYLADGISACGVPGFYEGGPDRAIQNLGDGRFYRAGVALEGELPLWYPPISAHAESAAAERRAAEDSLTDREREVEFDVRRLLTEMADNRRLLDAQLLMRDHTLKALEAEEEKLKGGRSTGFVLLQSQDLLLAAERQIAESRRSLRERILRYYALTGRLSSDYAELFPTR